MSWPSSPLVPPASESNSPGPHVPPPQAAQPRDYFALSIATSPREAAGGRPPVLDALEVARLFRDHFGLRFSEHIVCSDAAPAAHDLAISLRGAGLSDIQRALQDILRSMVASHEGGKRLSLLLHLNMQLSSSGDASASEAGSSPFPFEAGSSDALVAASLRLYKLTVWIYACCLFRCCTPPTLSLAEL